MTPLQVAMEALDKQEKALEAIAKQTFQDLNTVAGSERLAKWKTATATLLKQLVGDRVANQFSLAKPGPSFTNDLVEEFEGDVEVYRAALRTARKSVQAQVSAAPPA